MGRAPKKPTASVALGSRYGTEFLILKRDHTVAAWRDLVLGGRCHRERRERLGRRCGCGENGNGVHIGIDRLAVFADYAAQSAPTSLRSTTEMGVTVPVSETTVRVTVEVDAACGNRGDIPGRKAPGCDDVITGE